MTGGEPMVGLPPQATPRGPRRGTVLLLLLGAVGAALLLWWMSGREAQVDSTPEAVAVTQDSAAIVPAGVRVRVRVLNGSGRRGLGRRAALHLRDHGFDVVDWDTDASQEREATSIEVHGARDDWGTIAQRALGTGTVSARPDSLRYVDITIRLGRDWRPPAQPLRP
jgi:hypothetical protein